jgi:hypothetical protein
MGENHIVDEPSLLKQLFINQVCKKRVRNILLVSKIE